MSNFVRLVTLFLAITGIEMGTIGDKNPQLKGPRDRMTHKMLNEGKPRIISQEVSEEQNDKHQDLGSSCPLKMMAERNKQLNSETLRLQGFNEGDKKIQPDLGPMCPKKMMAEINKQLNAEALRHLSQVVREEDEQKQQMQQDINRHIESGFKRVPAHPKIATGVFRLFPPERINQYDTKYLKKSKTP